MWGKVPGSVYAQPGGRRGTRNADRASHRYELRDLVPDGDLDQDEVKVLSQKVRNYCR